MERRKFIKNLSILTGLGLASPRSLFSIDKNKEISTDFSLEDLTDFYRINGVNYRNEAYQVDLKKDLLDNRAQKTQDEWAEYSKKAIKNNEFHVGGMPLYHSLFAALFKNKDNAQYKDNIEKARKFLQKTCKDSWLMTLSRINYTNQGKDIIIHNHGLQDKLEVLEDIIGYAWFIFQLDSEKELKAVLGSNDINEINQVYNWISGKNAYILRLDSKPNQNVERAVGFVSDDDRFWLDWYGDPSYSGEAFGVRTQKISTGNLEKELLKLYQNGKFKDLKELEKAIEFYKKNKELLK